MIIDKLDNIRMYGGLLNHLENGLQAMEALRIPEVGRYDFDGGYFMVQKGTTKPLTEGTFEAHRKYVDIQIILEGSEEVAWQDITDLATSIEYNPEKDAERLTGKLDHVIKISEGMFYAAFPHDGHKPVSHTTEQQSFTKIVMKLPVA